MATPDYAQSVTARYGRRDLEAAVLDALGAVAKDLNSLTADDLAPSRTSTPSVRQDRLPSPVWPGSAPI
jgi:hypothetical protein